MKTVFHSLLFAALLSSAQLAIQAQSLSFHYLGHSAFLIIFDNGSSILCDYGQPNAYEEYGWSSPVMDIGTYRPTLCTVSHTHADHYDSCRIAACTHRVLCSNDTLEINGIRIIPFAVAENDALQPDNRAYLIEYEGIRVLHLGDCQADILDRERPETARRISQLPQNCDVVLLPIEGRNKLLNQLEQYISILQPETIIPMHYWSEEYKEAFLERMEQVSKTNGTEYRIVRELNSSYSYVPGGERNEVLIISLTPAPYTEK